MSHHIPHYFYALALPNETKINLNQICGELQHSWPFKRWVHHQDLHITLAFLGGVSEEKLAASKRQLESQLVCPSFPLTIDRLGVFGKVSSPRVFWAGVDVQPLLNQAQEVVYDACISSEIGLDTKPFKPHITLARNWLGDFPLEKQMLEQDNPFLMEPIPFQAEKIVLYKTNLGKEPKYEPIFTVALAGGQ